MNDDTNNLPLTNNNRVFRINQTGSNSQLKNKIKTLMSTDQISQTFKDPVYEDFKSHDKWKHYGAQDDTYTQHSPSKSSVENESDNSPFKMSNFNQGKLSLVEKQEKDKRLMKPPIRHIT